MPRPAPLDRFVAKVEIGDCWTWTAVRHRKGYGQFADHGMHQAHRWLWQQLVGPIPDGLELDHLCKNRACVNPDHLEPVTHAENVRRSRPAIVAAARQLGERRRAEAAKRTHCKWGHELTEENTVIYSGKRCCRYCNNRSHITAAERTQLWAD